jgi:hypothetical protein
MQRRRSRNLLQGRARLAVLLAVVGLTLAVGWATYARATTVDTGAGADDKPGQAGALAQTNEAGQVTVKVTWRGYAAGPAFDVVMDTHVVDLDGLDLQKLAVLRIDEGREVKPTNWEAPRGGHHRSGTLSFSATDPDGASLIGPNTRSLELIVRDVAGVPERAFRWQL